jgi:hypothetical protein
MLKVKRKKGRKLCKVNSSCRRDVAVGLYWTEGDVPKFAKLGSTDKGTEVCNECRRAICIAHWVHTHQHYYRRNTP